MSQNDSVVLGSTYGKSPKGRDYECVVRGCDKEVCSEYPPNCPKHKIRMREAR